MGPCSYCKKIIYDERIAERGYHRDCHEKRVVMVRKGLRAVARTDGEFVYKRFHFTTRELHKMDRRRIRRKELRDIKKGEVAT